MAFDASIPPWLVPKESPIDAMVKGVQAGTAIARTMQAGRQLALEAQRQQDQHELAEKQFDLQSKTQSLHNDILLRDVDAQQTDLPKWQDFTTKVNAAKTPDELSSVMESMPSFESDEYLSRAHSDIVTRSKVIGATSFAQAVAEQNLAEAKVVGYNAAWASELGKYPLNSPERVKALGGFQETMRKEQTESAAKLFERKETAIGDRQQATAHVTGGYRLDAAQTAAEARMSVAEIAARARTDSADISGEYRLQSAEATAAARIASTQVTDGNGDVQSSAILLPDHTVDPDHVAVRSGRATKIISVHDRNALGNLTVPQREAAIKSAISANGLMMRQTALDGGDIASYKTNIAKYTKMLDELLAPSRQRTTTTNAPAVTEKDPLGLFP